MKDARAVRPYLSSGMPFGKLSNLRLALQITDYSYFESEEDEWGVRNFPDDENERMVKNRMVVVLCTLKKLYSVLSIASTKLQHAPPHLSFIVI